MGDPGPGVPSVPVSIPLTTRLLHLYRIGPGPSSSHTLGPMRAARFVREEALARGIVPSRARVELMGSLSATGVGHHTDRAVLAGLQGWDPATCDVDALDLLPTTLAANPTIAWGNGTMELRPEDVVFVRFGAAAEALPHPNTLVFRLLGPNEETLFEETWCSVGGGFVGTADGSRGDLDVAPPTPPLHPFHDGASLLAEAARTGLGFGDLVLANERAWATREGEVEERLDQVWTVMRACIRRGLERRGDLPGGLGVRRRAAAIYDRVRDGRIDTGYAHIARAQAYAFAVNEENAAGGRVVTAPTNGAAGILPAVLAEVEDRMSLDAHPDPAGARDGRGDRHDHQGARQLVGGRGGLPGRGRERDGDGCRGALRDPGRESAAGRVRGRDRDGAQPGPHVRSRERSGAGPLHRAQRDGGGQGLERRAAGAPRRRGPR